MARKVVQSRLAACAQIAGQIESIYWWKGRVEKSSEWYVVMKTRSTLYSKLEKAIKALHPYETPEIVATRLTCGSAAYFKWIADETRPK
jgi:periplasmic divalent cation tolerance protein